MTTFTINHTSISLTRPKFALRLMQAKTGKPKKDEEVLTWREILDRVCPLKVYMTPEIHYLIFKES